MVKPSDPDPKPTKTPIILLPPLKIMELYLAVLLKIGLTGALKAKQFVLTYSVSTKCMFKEFHDLVAVQSPLLKGFFSDDFHEILLYLHVHTNMLHPLLCIL